MSGAWFNEYKEEEDGEGNDNTRNDGKKNKERV